ncbi:MAG: hypothetical protein Q9208_003315 [Pyrenodesmia sp. 3 TL-2023]
MNSPRNPLSPPVSASSASTPLPNPIHNRVTTEHSQTTAAGTTTRIRDNQRRSRARRKAYLEELEAKVRTYEAQGVEAASEIQAAARRVVEQNQELKEENERLRRLVADYERRWEGIAGDGESERAGCEQVSTKGTKSKESGKVDGKRKRVETGSTEPGKTMCGFGGLKACTGKGCEKDPSTTSSLSIIPQAPTPLLPAPTATSPILPIHQPTTSKNAYPSPPDFSLCSNPPKTPHDNKPPPLSLPPITLHPHLSSPSHSLPQQTPTIRLPLPQQQSNLPLPGSGIATGAAFPTSPDDTSSCVFAAQIITSMRSDVPLDLVRRELGCAEQEECEVDNKRLFTVMDRFA